MTMSTKIKVDRSSLAFFSSDNNSNPVSNNSAKPGRARRKSAKPPTRKPRGGKDAAAAGQAYLPGLSRRGRPRLKNAASPAARALESRKKRLEGGARRIEFMLEPDVAAMLDALAEHFKESRVELVSRLLAKAARRVLG